MTEVKPGQVWADNDRRSAGRTIRVLSIEGERALVDVLTEQGGDRVNPPRTTRILLRRFRPNSTGYRLIQDAPAGAPEGGEPR